MTPEPTTTSVPPLRQGQRLSQPEFHRRYEAAPPGVKAELIDGVVYMAPPLHQPHGSPHIGLATVLGLYQAATPGVFAVNNGTVILGPRSEPQPDLNLRILAEYGGQVRCGTTGVIVGAPELVAEISDTSVAHDLTARRKDYRRGGVLEYLVLDVAGGRLHAFDLAADEPIAPARGGIHKSRVFPGLWVDPRALPAGDYAELVRTAQRGLATRAHAAFVARLARRADASAKPRPERRRTP
jgi:Uma2 family endonuclease